MKFLKASRVVGALAGTLLLSSFASAASITGQFNVGGTVFDTATSISFGYIVPPTSPTTGDQLAAILFPDTGSFSALHPGETAGISNLTATSFVNWITLPNGINVDLTSIPIDMSIPVCTAGSTRCRAFASSPVILTQTPNGVSATVDFDGIAHFATGARDDTPIIGHFNAPSAGSTIAMVLDIINGGGGIETSYSANFVTSPPTPVVPEPASMALIGAGLLALGFLGKRKSVR